MPIVLETLGAINEDGLSLINALGGRCIATTTDPRERTLLFQRISMALQRGNVVSVTGSLKQEKCFFE